MRYCAQTLSPTPFSNPSPGKLADLAVFSGNLLTIPVDQILRTRVLYTVVGGKVVCQRKGAEAWRSGQLFKAMPEFDHVN